MKKALFSSLTLALSLLITGDGYAQQEFPVLKGPYLGQKAPGLIPQVFAPGIISIKGRSEYGMSFTPDLNEMYFTIQTKYGVPADIFFSKRKNNQWTAFEKANFTQGEKAGEMEPNVSDDGKRIYFTAYNADFSDTKIWYVNRQKDGWSKAIKLDSPVNDDEVMTSTLSKNGDLFYTNLSKGFKTYYSSRVNGTYPETHKADIDFGAHAFVSPSNDYLIVDARNREDESRKDADLYVYFKKQDDTWTKPINLGTEVNSSFDETVATVSPDGKYLFFSRRTEDGEILDLYWVSTEVIKRLKPKV